MNHKKLGVYLMVGGLLLLIFSFAFPLSAASNCAPNTAGLCLTGQTPNPSSTGQAVGFTGTAPTPPTGSVWTLYCNLNGGQGSWNICGATSSTGAWSASLTFSQPGTYVVAFALNNAGIAGGWVQTTQTVIGTGTSTTTSASTATTTFTTTTTSTLPVTTTVTSTIGGSTTTITSTITSFSTVPYTSVTTTTYVTTITSGGQTYTSTVTTTITSGSSLSSLGILSYLSFVVILVGAVIYWQGGKHR